MSVTGIQIYTAIKDVNAKLDDIIVAIGDLEQGTHARDILTIEKNRLLEEQNKRFNMQYVAAVEQTPRMPENADEDRAKS